MPKAGVAYDATAEPGSFKYMGVTGGDIRDEEKPSDGLSPTRGFWILVKSGDVGPKQFICPSSDDETDDTENFEAYFDFKTGRNVSYGYQIPYLARNPDPPSENAGSDMAVVADQSPHASPPEDEFRDISGGPTDNQGWDAANLENIKQFNSGNHGGQDNGDGQNVGYGDGHVTFHLRSDVGSNRDNIYRQTRNQERNNESWRYGYMDGNSPIPDGPTGANWQIVEPVFPDSLIYP
jgi:hypothetical protein